MRKITEKARARQARSVALTQAVIAEYNARRQAEDDWNAHCARQQARQIASDIEASLPPITRAGNTVISYTQRPHPSSLGSWQGGE